ncbi:phosphoethanolamine transferase [Thiomicrorhabdus aquaedulcis]|uniref:phosphoethanolamine transferase n=1 Tax=Thiomicrorhabdus aquaedulcis TaxID=2211106 RepID=UPI000FD7A7E4|nr:phosphoethanolamine transferase [Thiomicrorhabdus aquaedulcis]
MDRYLAHSSGMVLWVLMFPLLVFFALADDFSESELTARLGWLLLLVAISYVIKSKWLFLLLLWPFALSGVVDLFYTSTFNQQFEASLVRVLTDTDSAETLEFLDVYISLINVSLLVAYLLGFVYLGRKLQLFTPEGYKSKLVIAFGLIMLVVAVQQVAFHERYKDVLPGAFGQLTDGIHKYIALQDEMTMRPMLLQNYSGVVGKEAEKAPQTYVVVIGESAVRGHHGLYGYHRDTNPALTVLKNELILFDDVISPFAVTYLALSHALTQKSLVNNIPFAEALSLVELAKKGGFQTWWISNQPRYEGTTLSLSQVSDHALYLTDNGKTDSYLLPTIKQAIASPQTHKVIFVHLRGSHMSYAKRYPEEFDHFKSAELAIYTKTPSEAQVSVVNAYDNSIRYTDFILNEIVNMLKTQEQSVNGLVYFSDHGEEVYDYKNFIGHELKRVSPEMFEIPFIVWTNQNYQQVFDYKMQNMHKFRSEPFLNDSFLSLVYVLWD